MWDPPSYVGPPFLCGTPHLPNLADALYEWFARAHHPPSALLLPVYRLFNLDKSRRYLDTSRQISRRRKVEMFAACRRADGAQTHFDVRWQDGVLCFTGKLEPLPQGHSPYVQVRGGRAWNPHPTPYVPPHLIPPEPPPS